MKKHSGPQTVEEAHAEAIRLGARCLECPLHGCGEGPVMGELRRSRLLTIGKGPGKDEVLRRRPNVGPSGMTVRKGAPKASHTNAWLCRPPTRDDMELYVRRLRVQDRKRQQRERAKAKREGRKPRKLAQTPTPAQCCLPRLKEEIRLSKANTLLVLGREALKSVAALYRIPVGKSKEEHPDNLRLATLKSQMGHPFKVPGGPTLFVTMHPAAAMEGRSMPHMRHVINEHMRNARIIAKAGGEWDEPQSDEMFVPPERWTRAHYDEIRDWARRYNAAGRPKLTVDVETEGIDWHTKIRCIGLGADFNEKRDKPPFRSVLVIALRYRDGSNYWPPKGDIKVRAIVKKLLND